tara:strand:+ start:114 stop:365 length:252 start_codon:yes stop_codon:yes gene_type:complete
MNTNKELKTNYSFKRKMKQVVREKLKEMSSTEEEYQQNKKEYNRYMDCSLNEIEKYYKEHNAEYWTNTKKYYKVLYLMKLNKK